MFHKLGQQQCSPSAARYSYQMEGKAEENMDLRCREKIRQVHKQEAVIPTTLTELQANYDSMRQTECTPAWGIPELPGVR